MEIVQQADIPLGTLDYYDLVPGKVYTDVTDNEDDDLYLKLDMGLAALHSGMYHSNDEDSWVQQARFIEVNAKVVVVK